MLSVWDIKYISTRKLTDQSAVPMGQGGVKFSLKHSHVWKPLLVLGHQMSCGDSEEVWKWLFYYLPFESWGKCCSLSEKMMITVAAAVADNLICIVLFCIIFVIALECCITKVTDHIEFVLEERTKCMGGLERREDFPSVVMVRWNSPANHLVLSSPIEPMLENWPITGHLSSPGTGSVWSYNSW